MRIIKIMECENVLLYQTTQKVKKNGTSIVRVYHGSKCVIKFVIQAIVVVVVVVEIL